ncbi:hypothetical protein Tco_1196896 [Tanacetum coccineum]
MLEDFDRQDVMDLHRESALLIEPDEEDEIWKNQHEYNVISWSLYDFCGIHILLMQNGIAIHMLTEKKYPLSQEMISKMLNKRLEVDHESTQAYELLKFIRSQVQKFIDDVIMKKIVYHLFDDEVEFLGCVFLSYLLALEITCSCFHDFIDKDLIDLVLPDVRRYIVVLTGYQIDGKLKSFVSFTEMITSQLQGKLRLYDELRMYKLDLVILAPKVKNNREAHKYYLKHTIEQAAILRVVVEQAKSRNPLDSASYSACMYVKLIQELLGYVRDTCPDIHKPSEKLVAVTPINKNGVVELYFVST